MSSWSEHPVCVVCDLVGTLTPVSGTPEMFRFCGCPQMARGGEPGLRAEARRSPPASHQLNFNTGLDISEPSTARINRV